MRKAADQTGAGQAQPSCSSCLLCGLALICSQSVLAQQREPAPFWITSPTLSATASGLSITTGSLSGSTSVSAHTSLHGLIDIDRGSRGANIRGGIGMDFDLPDAGKLHLDMLPARDAVSRGMRWDMNGDSSRLEGKLWSLGACLEVVREPAYRVGGMGQRHLDLAPQLVLDADRLLDASGNGRLILQRVHWSDLKGRDEGLGAIWQLRMVWQF